MNRVEGNSVRSGNLLAQLRALKCEHGQGYFSKPVECEAAGHSLPLKRSGMGKRTVVLSLPI